MDGLYMEGGFIFMDTIKKYQLKKESAAEVVRLNREKKDKKKEGTSKPFPKKGCFVNKTTRTSRVTTNTSHLNFNMDIPQ